MPAWKQVHAQLFHLSPNNAPREKIRVMGASFGHSTQRTHELATEFAALEWSYCTFGGNDRFSSIYKYDFRGLVDFMSFLWIQSSGNQFNIGSWHIIFSNNHIQPNQLTFLIHFQVKHENSPQCSKRLAVPPTKNKNNLIKEKQYISLWWDDPDMSNRAEKKSFDIFGPSLSFKMSNSQ